MKRTPDNNNWTGFVLRMAGFTLIGISLGPLVATGLFLFWVGIEKDICGP